MKLVELIGRELEWKQPNALRKEYELRDGEALVANLSFRSAFGSFATGESGDGVWTFKRVGFWQPRATVRTSGSEAELAVFRNNTWRDGGTLELPDGRKFPADTNFWKTRYEFRTDANEPLISFRKIGGMLHLSAGVTIHPVMRGVKDLPWLALFGWYLTVLMYEDSAAIAAAAT